MTDLLAKAQAAPSGDKNNYDVLLPAVTTLRGKGWKYRAIHQWLRDEGARVHPNYITFASAMSRRIKHQNKHQ